MVPVGQFVSSTVAVNRRMSNKAVGVVYNWRGRGL